MKAAFIHDHIFPMYQEEYYESSGFDRVFVNRYLNIFGEVKIIARYSNIPKKPKDKFGILKENGLSFYTFLSTKELLTKQGRNELEKQIKECNYVVIRVPSVLGIISASICRELGIPYLVEVVGCPWDAVSNRGPKWILPAIVFALLTRNITSNANYVVYVTEEFLERRYPTKGSYISCSNVTLENYGSCNITRRTEKIKGFNKKEFTIGTCASIDTIYKGQDDAIRAISKLKEMGIYVKYQLAGGGDCGRLKCIAEKYEVIDQVKFLGELKHDDVFAWLDNIDIYVHPSKQEGLCRAIIEAMSRGCPIFAADAGGIHEQINNDCIFKKGDYKGLADMLKDCTTDNLTKYALENYRNAERYKASELYKRRNEFFSNFIAENME